MQSVEIELPPKLIPVFQGNADVRGAYGGRGSAKTRTFAKMTAVRAMMFAESGVSGIILCGRQFQNSLSDSSFSEVEQAIKTEEWLADYFDIGERYIRTKNGLIEYSFVGLERNINNIKSKARILLCWIDEAEPVTEEAWQILTPTIREDGSELWVTWNPARKSSATDKRFRNSDDPLVKVIELNWRDNPWFPAKLERVRVKDSNERPESYNHVWEGGYVETATGAYFAKQLNEARAQKRIGGKVQPDPLLPIKLFCDIGGTGNRSDAFAMWAAQFVGREIRVLNYYEATGQPLAVHLAWCRKEGYTPEVASFVLPHDGAINDRVYDVSFQSAIEDAGYDVQVIPNQGAGAAMMRVEAVRRYFSMCWFDERTQPGVEALGWYHPKIDDKRSIDLGPDHDWSSHGADAFGLMCVCVKEQFGESMTQEEEDILTVGSCWG